MSELFPYVGGKTRLADRICQFFPVHQCYAELFAGSVAVLLSKSPSPVEMVNDSNQDLANFFDVLRHAGSDRDILNHLQYICRNILYSRHYYERWQKDWSYGWRPADPVERAAVWYYLQCASLSGKFLAGWGHSPDSQQAGAWFTHVEGLAAFAQRFRTVQVECRDFRRCLEVWDREGVLWYVDPPYIGAHNEDYYGEDFQEQDHVDLAQLLHQAKGKVILSYSDHPLVRELYGDWQVLPFPHSNALSTSSAEGKKAIVLEDLVLANFEPYPLFRGGIE